MSGVTFTRSENKALYDELVSKYPGCPEMWRYFLALTEVPRPSKHTERVSKWAQEVGKKLGGTVRADAAGNVAINIPATPGLEDVPAVVLQAHLDMVPTKTAQSKHNFETDPIECWIDGDVLRAKDTTLGGDDGSGVAAIFAVAEACPKHGPFVLLFTVDEELGLLGANKLVEGELLPPNAKYLVNVDSEDWGEITLSCAGGVDRILKLPVTREAARESGWSSYEMVLQDFKGGHSGCDIHLHRASTTKWAMEIIGSNRAVINGAPYRISSFVSGHAHNAIPSRCTVVFDIRDSDAENFIQSMQTVFKRLFDAYAEDECSETKKPQMSITKLEEDKRPAKALTFSSSRSAICAISGLQQGVWRWSEVCPTLVETSQSIAVTNIKADEGDLEIEIFARSSNNDALEALRNYLKCYAALYGGIAEAHTADYPGWPADPHTKLCETATALFKREFGVDAKITSIHAGLECGIVMNKYPANKLEAISIGPDVKNPHTTMEHLGLASCEKLYRFLVKLVAELAQK